MVILHTCVITVEGGCLFARSFMSKVTPCQQDKFHNPFAAERLSWTSYLCRIITRINSEEHSSPGNMCKNYVINIYGGTEEVFSAQHDTLSNVTCFCCHTGQAVTLLPGGQLAFMGAMISENSHTSHINLNFMFMEDKMITSTVRKLLIHNCYINFAYIPDWTKCNSLSDAGCM